MGFFKSLKGKVDVGTDGLTSSDSTGQQQTHDGWSTTQEKRRLFGRNDNDNENQLSSTSSSSGRRQGQGQDEEYAPPPGPPPSHRRAANNSNDDEFLPPPGPPPSHSHSLSQRDRKEAFKYEAPPPGPPPSHSQSETASNPPPYHDWTIIPDTSLLPPPPPLPEDHSPTNNASYDSAERAHAWCAANPVYTPSRPAHEIHLLANAGHLTLEAPPAPPSQGRRTRVVAPILRQTAPTKWSVSTKKGQQDTIIQTNLPVYFAAVDAPTSPLTPTPTPGQFGTKTIYYEIRIQRILDNESGIALGFAAKPYPSWRLPGWHRASWAVHGDDGRRFVNDSWGGRDFVDAFRTGEVVGVGMRFASASSVSDIEGATNSGVRCFMTRDGRGGPDDPRFSWDVDEQRDERDEGVEGLRGDGDLYPAIGVFGAVEFEVCFGESVLWRGR